MNILIAEDEAVSRRLLLEMLDGVGSVQTAVDGREAVDKLRAAQEAAKPYDLVCLDILMPELDGQEVLCALRAMEAEGTGRARRRATVIMTTAVDDLGAISDAFEGLCDAYLVKPVLRTDLFDTLAALGLVR